MPKVYHYFNVGQLPQTLNSVDGQNPLLLSINKTEYATKENNPTHSHKYLEFFYILDGEGEFITGETHLPLKKHDILVVNAEVIHVQRSTAPDRPLTFYSLLLDNIHINTFKKNHISENDFLYQPFQNENNEFFTLISRLLKELSDKKNGYYLALKGIVLELFVALYRIANGTNASSATKINPAIKAAKEYIDVHFTETISLGDLAKLAYTDKYYLAHQFKKHIGTTPSIYRKITTNTEAAPH